MNPGESTATSMVERARNIVDQSPIFIVGTPRSGTTLMGKILDRHPDISVAGETHFFIEVMPGGFKHGSHVSIDDIYSAAAKIYKNLGVHRFYRSQRRIEASFSVDDLIDLAQELGSDYRGLYQAFASLVSVTLGGKRLVDDTPRHIFNIDTIIQMFPDAKFVGMLRDPRAFLASYKNLWKITGKQEERRIRSLYHPLLSSVYWRSANSILFKYAASNKNLHIVRYKNLVTNPEREVQGVVRFLGQEYDGTMLEVENSNSSFGEERTGIFTTSLTKWREELEPHEIWIAQRVNKSMLERMELSPEPANPRLAAILWTVGSAPFSLLRTFWTNSERRGPLLEYLWRRIRGLFVN